MMFVDLLLVVVVVVVDMFANMIIDKNDRLCLSLSLSLSFFLPETESINTINHQSAVLDVGWLAIYLANLLSCTEIRKK